MPKFNDIVGHPDAEHIRKLVDLKVVSGYGDGRFGTDDLTTREQFAKMLILAAGIKPDETAPLSFADNAEISSWVRVYVATAVKYGLIKGVGQNRFAPKEQVTRAAALTMIVRDLEGEEAQSSTPFADDDMIPVWARSAVSFALKRGIVSTDDFTELAPGRPSTRAENARFLSRFIAEKGQR